MSEKVKDTGGIDCGGNAFPVSDGTYTEGGMLLLDWFAGQALAQPRDAKGWDAIRELAEQHKIHPCEALARVCYDFAQAMIAEKRRREKP